MSTVRNQMEAAYITGFGSSDEIRIGNLPVPEAGAGEVLVRVGTVAANHVDTFVRSGAYRTDVPFPFVIGRDLVGTLVEPGGGHAPGDRVWCNSLGHNGRQGSFAEYAVVPESRLYPLPEGVDPEAAVSVLHTGATAHLGLFRDARLKAGETIVVAGAGSGVGSAAVQLASAAGARVIAVDRATNAGWCHACGAAEMLDRDDPDVAKRIAALAPPGVDVYWDCARPPDFDAVLPLLAPGGRLVLSAGMTVRATLPIGALYTRDISVHGFVISNATAEDLRAAAENINRELATGRLRGRIRARLRFADSAAAHRMLEARTRDDPPGRIVLAR